MRDPDRYVALIASLPSSERLFFAKQPPLSRLRLERRLRVLTAEDAAVLQRIETVLSWRSYGMEVSAEAALARFEQALPRIPQPTLKAIVRERLALRCAVAALRRRAAGDGPPRGPRALGPHTRRFVENWSAPEFGLGRAYPWLAKAAALIAERDPIGFERHILETSFRQLNRHAAWHPFDFEAVAIYVLKWSIFDRWARSNATAARRRFERLTAAALADFPDVLSEGGVDGAAA